MHTQAQFRRRSRKHTFLLPLIWFSFCFSELGTGCVVQTSFEFPICHLNTEVCHQLSCMALHTKQLCSAFSFNLVYQLAMEQKPETWIFVLVLPMTSCANKSCNIFIHKSTLTNSHSKKSDEWKFTLTIFQAMVFQIS